MLGKVWLVGAGPGDASLVTVKGLACIQQADVIVFDRLVNPQLLAYARADCEQIDVGKNCHHHPIPQEEINTLLVEQARLNKRVVRLKSGDPYVFGRGAEEVEALVQAQIAFEVIPGVSSAIGGLAYAGIPVTHRDYASSFHVVTGHLKEGKDPLNWSALATLDGTLVILMGITNMAYIFNKLIQNGRPSDTPVAIVMWATRAHQRVVISDLEHMTQVAKEQQVAAPAVIVVGDVVNLHHTLDFSKHLTEVITGSAS